MKEIPLEEIKAKLLDRYRAQGFGENLFRNDWNLVLRVGIHPQKATVEDLQQAILRANSQATRANYASRLKSVYKALRKMGLIDSRPDEDLPDVKKKRGLPHPLTRGEAQLLMTEARMPMRHWFILGCCAGLRAMEVSKIRGIDLEEVSDGHILRVYGKGGTDLAVPVAPVVADLIKSYGTRDRLFAVTANKLSSRASKEMKRLGIPKKTFHSCRHYFATTMLEKSGGDLLAVRDLMRHSSVETTQVYTQLATGRTRSLVNLIE